MRIILVLTAWGEVGCAYYSSPFDLLFVPRVPA
jgi:hypothetical protein